MGVIEHESYARGWAMSFLPGTDFLAITEKDGTLKLRDQTTGEVADVAGTPTDVYSIGQGGLHDVIPGPNFAESGEIYLSWVRRADADVLGAGGGQGSQNGQPTADSQGAEPSQGVVGRGFLDLESKELRNLEVVWEQTPTIGNGHFALRLLVHDGYLFVTSGERQKFDPAQDRSNNLGAVLRLTVDGKPAPGNPWADEGDTAAELWTIGHRNPLGIDVDSSGQIWVAEMGPQGGDELNRIEAGANYGWPEVSMGNHYEGDPIADHAPGDGFTAPVSFWNPSISPGGLHLYRGERYPQWHDDALLAGLSGQQIVRVDLEAAREIGQQQWDMGT